MITGANAITPVLTYYPRVGNTDLSKVAQWTTNLNGTGGISPPNFTANGQIFVVSGVTNATPTIAANLTITGAGSFMVVGDGLNPVNFTIPAAYRLTTKLTNIKANATLTICNRLSLTSILWPNDFDANSTIDFLNLGSFTLPILTSMVNGYGSIILDNSSVNNVIIANVAFAGNLTLQNTGSFNSTFLSLDLRGSNNQIISGNNLMLTVNDFIDTLKTGGNITLAPNTPMNFEKDMWLNQSGLPNQFSDGGNTLSCLGNLNMNGVSTGYNFTGTMIIAGSQGVTPQRLDDNGQYALPGAIVAQLNNLVINCNNPVQFVTNANNTDLTINGNFIIASAGNHPVTLCTTKTATGRRTFNFLGDFINNQTLNLILDTTTIYNFNGTNGQTIYSAAGTETFANMTFNDPANFTLGSAFTITNVMALTNGIINANDTTDVITLALGATLSGVGSTTTYVNGPMIKMGNSAFVFPIGGANGRYMPLAITAPSSVTNAIYADYILGPPVNISFLPPTLTNVSSMEYWYVSQTMPDQFTVTLNWQNGPQSGIYYYDTTLKVAQYTGGIWNDLGNSNLTGTFPGAGSITAATQTISSLNWEITFGSDNYTNNPLPITLSAFTANYVPENNTVLVNWTAATQLNNKEFVVEKTTDGINYTEVATEAGAGTTPFSMSYTANDNSPTPGITYYRLKQIDVDGNSTTFTPVPVDIAGNQKKLSQYLSQSCG